MTSSPRPERESAPAMEWVCPSFSALDAKTIMAFSGRVPRVFSLLWANSDDLFQKNQSQQLKIDISDSIFEEWL
jgi:hypothetical protein